jgi:SAM-dependent methyltransferase
MRRVVRRLQHALDSLQGRLSRREAGSEGPNADGRRREVETFLLSLDFPPDARRYLEEGMQRFTRTLTLVPPPRGSSGRVLELGSYMQMTPALAKIVGYPYVRGAYLGPLGRTDTKVSTVGGREIFRCEVDHFDVERDRFPYEDGWFETVLACEIIEHLLLDPMHMLLEIHRVLEEGGTMVLTTPNITSYNAVYSVLEQSGNPQLYSHYPRPAGEGQANEAPHVREYAPSELQHAVEGAGFEIESLVTEAIPTDYQPRIRSLLRRLGYSTEARGELMFCVARKRSGLPVTRYPDFLYDA